MNETQNLKTERLKELLADMGSVLVSFSGGVDSALLLHVASEVLGEKAKAVTFISPIFPSIDLARAEGLAAELKVPYLQIPFNILSHQEFLINDRMRCRTCKMKMVEALKKEAATQGIDMIADGANQDDLSDYRPGLKASRKAGIRSPLMEAGFTKDDIRREANKRKIEAWNAPASACLASRIAYGTPIRESDLSIIEKAEALLHEFGFREVRVRYHAPVARIEVSAGEIPRLVEFPIREKVIEGLKSLGFTYVTLDLSGYRSGSMNELLS
ncbi:MAG: ATP-dependent sacrificial sulfur transferase LarE [Deltaproteobacteria bacterium]|nr:ATP-dependent sacrificial sulfur transferase LarE [Deltaproteobacteria bacterium]